MFEYWFVVAAIRNLDFLKDYSNVIKLPWI